MAELFTVGHGARSAEELIGILKQAGIDTLVDVRAYPASRRHPQFSRDRLARSLEGRGLGYRWEGEALGGLREGGGRSRHTALKQPMFRAYAEHMESGQFRDAAAALARLPGRTCIMCAESDPRQCHRSLIADWLVAHGHRVLHLIAPGEQREHVQNPAVRMEGENLVYAGAQPRLL